jgi:hypothetical protein
MSTPRPGSKRAQQHGAIEAKRGAPRRGPETGDTSDGEAGQDIWALLEQIEQQDRRASDAHSS